MDRHKILIADDEARMRKLVHDFLTRAGFTVVEASDGEETLDIFYADRELSLIILDVMMPGRDGLSVCREIRETDANIPVIMLTAKDSETDELSGFDAGADEYISKPFSPKILVARVEALLRRTTEPEQTVIECRGIVLDTVAHSVTIDSRPVGLSVKEFELLKFFLENQNVALPRERILSTVWDYDYFGDARTIDTHVKKLRAKMGEKGALIKTIWGMGYKLEVL